MPNAQVVASFTENGFACLAVAVTEADGMRHEFIGRVAMDEDWQALSAAQKKAALVAAAKTIRDASIRPANVDLGVSGIVQL